MPEIVKREKTNDWRDSSIKSRKTQNALNKGNLQILENFKDDTIKQAEMKEKKIKKSTSG